MSTIAVSYSSIKDASNEAKSVAKKLNEYAGTIENTVYNKLNNYNEECYPNLSNAKLKANDKKSSLGTTAGMYTKYSTDLDELLDKCKEVDRSVKSGISLLTETFKENHGIRNSKVENAIGYFFTAADNSTGVGRWLGDGKDKFTAGANYLKDSIKKWYNYDGGKDAIFGVILGRLLVSAGALAIAGALATGGPLIVIIAGVVLGAIALVNGIMNIYNELKAYSATHNDDPATGKRRSKIDTFKDHLKSSFIFGDDGTKYEYSKLYNGAALGIGVVEVACTIVNVVSSCGKLLKNGYKWATGNVSDLKDISFKRVFSKNTLSAYKGKFCDIKTSFKANIKANSLATIKSYGSRLLSVIGRNLKAEFLDFGDDKSAVSSMEAIINIPIDLLEGGFNAFNILGVGVKRIGLPSLTAFTVNSVGGGVGGQMQFYFTEQVTFKDFYEIGDNINAMFTDSSGFKEGGTVDLNVIEKLAGASKINISIPEFNMPSIELPVDRVA